MPDFDGSAPGAATPTQALDQLAAAHATDVVNVAEGRRHTRNNDKLYLRLLIKFRDTNAGTVASLRAHCSAQRQSDVSLLLHSLRSTAATLGLGAVARTAFALEHLLAPAQSSAGAGSSALGEHIDALERALAETLTALTPLRPID
jgi:HPt (histidine-containing phosphotransfer) domain-containing protein